MRLKQARVQNYRSIRDTGWFDVEEAKTILVGPNEAGKTALLEALQQINAPADTRKFDQLRGQRPVAPMCQAARSWECWRWAASALRAR